MPTIQDEVSVAANSTSVNVLEGKLYRFVPRGQRVSVSATGAATGVRATMLNGVPIVDDQLITDANRFPIIPDDVLTQFQAPGGEMILRFRNTTGAAINVRWRVDL